MCIRQTQSNNTKTSRPPVPASRRPPLGNRPLSDTNTTYVFALPLRLTIEKHSIYKSFCSSPLFKALFLVCLKLFAYEEIYITLSYNANKQQENSRAHTHTHAQAKRQ